MTWLKSMRFFKELWRNQDWARRGPARTGFNINFTGRSQEHIFVDFCLEIGIFLTIEREEIRQREALKRYYTMLLNSTEVKVSVNYQLSLNFSFLQKCASLVLSLTIVNNMAVNNYCLNFLNTDWVNLWSSTILKPRSGGKVDSYSSLVGP